MPDYKEMYLKLFRSVTEAVIILQEAQRATEEMYISAEPPDLLVLDTIHKKDDKAGKKKPHKDDEDDE
jgi:hypothetical protein